ncbi:glycosyltransferase [Yoonia sp.]|uniref:MraY family glycosyltransferase n=1 Tax=Yoonia sp. TaxID=2212373 RepID=UPI00232B1D18|nr:glycosyltransferase [Yoonia sp.]MDB4240800.1 glycosyltransferase [Yoonia sp.]
MQFDPDRFLQPYHALLVLISFTACIVIIALAKFVPRLRGRENDTTAVQSMHVNPTPRVGGLAIFGGLACSVVFFPVQVTQGYVGFALAMSMLFLVGLREDLGFDVSPRLRLLVLVGASLVVVVVVGEWLPRIGVFFLDPWLSYWVLGVPVTLLISAGVANGFNLIDGVNGLAAMTATTAAVALAVITQQSGYTPMANVSMMLAAVIFGFFLVNFPFGLIFLGDAGAYTIGFVLAWFGIAVIVNAPAVSPWAILLTVFWPLADTLLAIYRRTRRNTGAMLPDRLHVHQLAMRGLEICFLGRKRRNISNSLTTVVLAPFVIAPQIVAVLLWDDNRNAFYAVVVFLVLFFVTYAGALSVVRNYRLKAVLGAHN